MNVETASVVSANADNTVSLVAALGNLLKYGVPGLALAIIIICFVSLHFLQKQSLMGKVPPETLAPFERLQKLYLFASVGVFCISTIAPRVLDYYFEKAPVNSVHRLAFNLSPTSFEREDLAPRLVVAGQGLRIAFQNGTGQDKVDGDKTYQLDVDQLVKEISTARYLALQQQLRQPQTTGEHNAFIDR
jgi:hypothetical protein